MGFLEPSIEHVDNIDSLVFYSRAGIVRMKHFASIAAKVTAEKHMEHLL